MNRLCISLMATGWAVWLLIHPTTSVFAYRYKQLSPAQLLVNVRTIVEAQVTTIETPNPGVGGCQR